MINVVIADDHVLIREGLKKLIDRRMGMKVTGECERASEVIDTTKKGDCDVLVLDINLPDKNGLDLLQELLTIQKNLKVLVLSMHPESMYAVRAMKLGAAGYLTKSAASTELLKAIELIWSGGRYISEIVGNHLAIEIGFSPSNFPHEKLSNREFQVLLMIASGKSQKEMASFLNIALSTVNTYRQRILLKMNMKSNQELIRYCFKNNLVD